MAERGVGTHKEQGKGRGYAAREGCFLVEEGERKKDEV